MTNGFFTTSNFENFGDFATDINEVIPFSFQSFVDVFFFNFRPGQHLYGKRSISRFFHELPYFFHSEAENRSKHYHQVHKDFVHSGLCATTFFAVCFVSIETIFENIQVVAGHFNSAEVMDCMIEYMEFVVFVCFGNFFFQELQVHQCPTIQFKHFIERNCIFFIVEVIDVAEDITHGITNFTICFGKLFYDFRGNTDICFVIGRSSPQTNDISTVLVNDFLRNHYVTNGFGHFATFAVYYITVSQYGFVRSFAGYSNCSQQGGLEPTTMLVTAFQVHISNLTQFRTLHYYRLVSGTTVEPNVHDVSFFMEVVMTAFRANSASRHQFFSRTSPPSIATFFSKYISNRINGCIVNQMFTTFVAVEYRDGNAPSTLTADAPVMTFANHVVDTLLAPSRNPFYIFIDCFQCIITETVNGSKPLSSCTEDDGVFTTPAVSVLVFNVFFAEEHVQLGQVFQNRNISIENKHASKAFACFCSQFTLFINRAKDGQFVFQTSFKVDITVTRSSMYATSTSFSGNVVSHYNQGFTIKFRHGMFAFCKFHFFTFYSAKNVAQVFFANSANLFKHIFSHEYYFAFNFNPSIFQFRVQCYCNVCRHGPGSSGPNNHGCLFAFCCFRHFAQVINDRHFYIDGRSFLFAVFDFSFSQSSFAMGAPVNGFLTFIDVAFFSHFAKYADLFSFNVGIQSYIGIFPVAKNAQTFEVFALQIDEAQSVIMALTTQSQVINFFTVQAQFFDCSVFDRHTVSIPTRNIRSVETTSVFVFNDDIFQDFVQSMTHVDFAVCIRRAIVKDEFFTTCMQFLFFPVDFVFFPELFEFRFALRQVCTHGEFSFGQIQSFAVIHCHCVSNLQN